MPINVTLDRPQREALFSAIDSDVVQAFDTDDGETVSPSLDMEAVSLTARDLPLPKADGNYTITSLPRKLLVAYLRRQIMLAEEYLPADELAIHYACTSVLDVFGETHDVCGGA